MITRSKSKNTIHDTKYRVDIDFDEASREWNANKRNIGNGEYIYVCGKKMRNDRKCLKPPTTNHIYSAIVNEEI